MEPLIREIAAMIDSDEPVGAKRDDLQFIGRMLGMVGNIGNNSNLDVTAEMLAPLMGSTRCRKFIALAAITLILETLKELKQCSPTA